MPLIDRNDSTFPPEWKDLTDEQILVVMKAGTTAQTDLKAAQDLAVTKEQELQAANAERDAAKAKADAALDPANPLNKPVVPAAPDPNKPIDFWEDPDAALTQRLTPLALQMFTQGAQTAEMFIRQRNPKLFAKFGDEIMELMKTVPLQQRPMFQTWENAILMVKGRHLNEFVADAKEGKNEFFTEPASSGAPHVPEVDPSATPESKLNDQEKKVAERMRMTPAEYLKQKEGMVVHAA
jgi:hypothetical protein